MATRPAITPPVLDKRALRILRLRRRARLVVMGIVLLLLAAVIASRAAGDGAASTDHDRYHQRRFRVLDVAQGDELRVASDESGAPLTVRLIGVDANGSAEAQRLAQAACGHTVLLYLETVPTRNHAGELMAYVYAADGTLVNGSLVASGAAFADRRWDYSFLKTFLQAEEQASSRKAGMWAGMSEAQMPEWRRRWLAEMRKEPWKRQEWRRADEP